MESLKTKVYQAARDGMAITVFAILCNKNVSEVEEALQFHTEEDGQSLTPLILAARNGHEKVVQTLLSHFEVDLEQTGTIKFDGYLIESATALWCAAGAGHLEVVTTLVEAGCDVNHSTKTNSTPLRAACFDGRLDIVRYLIEHNANINIPNKYNNTCLMISSYRGHDSVVRYLLEQGADPSSRAHCGATALHFAAECGHLHIVKSLLEYKADNSANDHGMTPLMVAAESSQAEVVEYLIGREDCGKVARVEALELLGASYANDKDHYNIEKSFHYIRLAMLERYADPTNVLVKKVLPPVEAYENHIECDTVEKLSEYDGNSDAIHIEALIIRERILGVSNPEVPHPIVFRGAVFADTAQFDRCISLWMHALKIRHDYKRSVTKDLLRFAQVFAQMFHLNYPVESQVVLKVLDYAVLELQRNLSTNHTHDEMESLSDIKIANMHIALYLIAILTDIKLDKDEEILLCRYVYQFVRLGLRLENGYTPLHMVCDSLTQVDDFHVNNVVKFPNALVAKLLLKCGAKVNAVDTRQNTALHVIVRYNKPVSDFLNLHNIIFSLVEYGAHMDIANEENLTPYQASTTGVAEIILRTLQKVCLKCIAARAVKKNNIQYKGHVPIDLEEFIEMH